jgi:hypothetical protein
VFCYSKVDHIINSDGQLIYKAVYFSDFEMLQELHDFYNNVKNRLESESIRDLIEANFSF